MGGSVNTWMWELVDQIEDLGRRRGVPRYRPSRWYFEVPRGLWTECGAATSPVRRAYLFGWPAQVGVNLLPWEFRLVEDLA